MKIGIFMKIGIRLKYSAIFRLLIKLNFIERDSRQCSNCQANWQRV